VQAEDPPSRDTEAAFIGSSMLGAEKIALLEPRPLLLTSLGLGRVGHVIEANRDLHAVIRVAPRGGPVLEEKLLVVQRAVVHREDRPV